MSNLAFALPAVPVVTPFKFLNYYDDVAADRQCFAGREREVVEIADAATTAGALIFYGKSGLGKTSVLLAGVFPELRRRGYLPVHVRTLRDPMADLTDAVRDALALPALAERSDLGALDGEMLIELLRGATADRSLVLVLDQFEEFFIRFGDQRERYDEFLYAIARIINDSTLHVHVVFSLREDYIAALDDFRQRVPNLFENEYRLRPMSAFGVREAIMKPLEVAGIDYDPRLIAGLVDQLAEYRFDSVILQILCQEVFDRATHHAGGDVSLSAADLKHAGDIEVIFRRYLDDLTRDLRKEDGLGAHVVLYALTTQERTKRALRLEELEQTLYQLDAREVERILDSLIRHRLVRVDERGGERWYELTHERLVRILEPWLRLDRDFNTLLTAYDLVAMPARAEVFRDSPSKLLPAGFLDMIGPFRERLNLTANELEFLVRSAMYCRHEHLGFWTTRFSHEASRTLIEEGLGATDAKSRRGAAHAAGVVLNDDADMLPKLLQLALHDADASVRREAARALNRLGDDSAIQGLRRAYGERRSRDSALNALVDMHVDGSSLRDLSPWLRRKVRGRARARLRRDNAGVLEDVGTTGWLAGLRAVVTWTFSVAPFYVAPITAYVFVTVDRGRELSTFWLAALLILFMCLTLGLGFTTLLASRISRVAALQMLQGGPCSFALAVCRSKAFLAIALYTVGIAASAAADRSKLLWILPSGFWLLLPISVHIAERSFSSACDRSSIGRHALVASVGLPILVPGLTMAAVEYGSRELHKPFVPIFECLFAMVIISSLTAGIVAALGQVIAQHREQLPVTREESPPSRAWWYVSCGLAFAALALMAAFLGPTFETAFPAHELSVRSEPLTLTAQLPHARVLARAKLHRIRITAPTSKSQDSLAVRVRAFGGAHYLNGARLEDEVRILRPGEHALVQLNESPTEAPLHRILLEPVGAIKTNRADLGRANPYALAWARWRDANKSAAMVSGRGASPNSVVGVALDDKLLGSVESEKKSASVSCAGGRPVQLAIRDDKPSMYFTGRVSRLHCLVAADASGKFSVKLNLSPPAANTYMLLKLFPMEALPLTRASLDSSAISGANVEEIVDASFASFVRATLRDLRFDERSLVYAALDRAALERVSFDGADLSHATLRNARAARAGRPQVSFRRANLAFADLSGADLSEADFSQAAFFGTNLSGASLSRLTEEQVQGACGVGEVQLAPPLRAVRLLPCLAREVRPKVPPRGACEVLEDCGEQPSSAVGTYRSPGTYHWDAYTSTGDSCKCTLDRRFVEGTEAPSPSEKQTP